MLKWSTNDIKIAAVLGEVRQKIDQAFHINVRAVLDDACRSTRADMTTAEKNQLFDKYIKSMHIEIAPDGEATIVLGKWCEWCIPYEREAWCLSPFFARRIKPAVQWQIQKPQVS